MSERSAIRNEPFKSEPESSTITWGLGGGSAKLVVHATGPETGLACTIAEHIWEPGDAGGFHAHMVEDEAFFIIEGEVTVEMPDDGETFTAGPGELIWHPRGRKHDYKVSTSGPARLLQILIPGSDLVPGFFEAVAAGKADDIGTPEGAAEFFDWSRSAYNVEFFPPSE
jgi:quercetin dioxygenase-like cupin family protein